VYSSSGGYTGDSDALGKHSSICLKRIEIQDKIKDAVSFFLCYSVKVVNVFATPQQMLDFLTVTDLDERLTL